VLTADTSSLVLLDPRNVCLIRAVGIPGVETPSRRKRSVLRRGRRMVQSLVRRFRLLGCIASGLVVFRSTDRGDLWTGIGMMAGDSMSRGMVVDVGGDEGEMALRRQAVGVRPSRLLNSIVAAPLFTGLRQAQHTIRGSQPSVLWPHQSVADCFDWLGPAWEIVITPRARSGRTESESKLVGLN
jgi:hypothetical protein